MNDVDVRHAKNQLRRDNKRYPLRLTEVPKDQWPAHATESQIRILRSKDFLVQVFRENNMFRLSVCRTRLKRNGDWDDRITWDELQRLKQEAGYGDCDAVEIYPAEKDVVNVANMRHLWVFTRYIPFAWRKS